ncbi:AIPR family protein [Nitratireductor sp. GZWM139]|uniref:AIPR family protein n=1 Tax=Nitratireductor sp. GZWM139 TaxID=2950541 RepID=UPI0024BDDCE5|nr:AIPR family protein [Nitratireductor sp. GZWM139]MDJ1463805.1 AIPR family protein [Nitratireductor sp. GZWM139]
MAMNPIVRAQLKDFKSANPSEEGSDSEFFEVMSIFAVENGILGENINPFRAHLKGEEFGIDGIAISVQGILCVDEDEASSVLSVGKNHVGSFHMYQSKMSNKLDYGQVSKFLDAVYDFFTDLKLLKGPQIDDLVGARDQVFAAATRSNPDLKCYFCTTGSGEVSSEIDSLIQKNKERLKELNVFGSIDIICLGARSIQEAFRAATNSSSASIFFPKNITLPEHSSAEEAYIGYVTADQVLEMALGEPDSIGERHINRALFYDNVRDFNPNSDINKSILKEIECGDLSSFVFKNNGITVVAKSISRKGDTFKIDDYQIVNGCQTTNILAQARDSAGEISVPLRLIGSSDPDFVSKIIVGTNKQNEVREDQFWALLPFMKDLEIYCSGQDGDERILIERRDNQYRDVAIERTRIMKPSDLMKVAAAAFFFQPNRAARDHRGIRKEFSKKIFLRNHSVELYHMAALSLYKFDYLVRTSRVPRTFAINKFYVLYALVRQFWTMPNILEASGTQRSSVHRSVMSVIRDNSAYAAHIEKVSKHIEKLIGQSEARTREQLRDFIRTERFSENFTQTYFIN